MAIVFGVIQMSFGIYLNVHNYLHQKKPMYILLETVPQMIFLWCLFGYLVAIIIYKWSVDWSDSEQSPPGLLNTLIYMFLKPGNVEAEDELYSGQVTNVKLTAGDYTNNLVIDCRSLCTMDAWWKALVYSPRSEQASCTWI